MAKRGKKVLWSPRSRRDLDAIIDYYARVESLVSGEAMVRKISADVELLRENMRLWGERDDLRGGVRAVHVEPYLVFYRISGSNAEIARVLHERRDIRTIFKKMNTYL